MRKEYNKCLMIAWNSCLSLFMFKFYWCEKKTYKKQQQRSGKGFLWTRLTISCMENFDFWRDERKWGGWEVCLYPTFYRSTTPHLPFNTNPAAGPLVSFLLGRLQLCWINSGVKRKRALLSVSVVHSLYVMNRAIWEITFFSYTI